MSHRARVRRFVLRASASFLFLLLVAAPASAEIDLIGSWFVLIHYRDSQTANPDSDRWEDKVWKIEKKGSRAQRIQAGDVKAKEELVEEIRSGPHEDARGGLHEAAPGGRPRGHAADAGDAAKRARPSVID